jgi:IMP dehydrogenase
MQTEYQLSFDDVLIRPKFSDIKSRSDVIPGVILGGRVKLRMPIISSNMATITGVDMARAVSQFQGLAVLHRFWSITDNVKAFYASTKDNGYKDNVGVSIGLGAEEQERAKELANAGAWIFVVDVAHGAQQQVVDQYKWLRKAFPSAFIMVGNFATSESIEEFERRCGEVKPNCYKVGIGAGSVCTTRIKTGIGIPQLSCLLDCAKKFPVVSDGGHRFPQDICKALAAGAQAVMLGGMLSGTDEADGTTYKTAFGKRVPGRAPDCLYQGSAYKAQPGDYDTSEGAKVLVEYKGPVLDELKKIEGGIRSSLSYVGALCLSEYREMTEFVRVSSSTINENIAHAKIRWK